MDGIGGRKLSVLVASSHSLGTPADWHCNARRLDGVLGELRGDSNCVTFEESIGISRGDGCAAKICDHPAS